MIVPLSPREAVTVSWYREPGGALLRALVRMRLTQRRNKKRPRLPGLNGEALARKSQTL